MPLSEQDLTRIGEVVALQIAPLQSRLDLGDQSFRDIRARLDSHSADLDGAGPNDPGIKGKLAAVEIRASMFRPVWMAFLVATVSVIVGGVFVGTVWVIRSIPAAPSGLQAPATRP